MNKLHIAYYGAGYAGKSDNVNFLQKHFTGSYYDYEFDHTTTTYKSEFIDAEQNIIVEIRSFPGGGRNASSKANILKDIQGAVLIFHRNRRNMLINIETLREFLASLSELRLYNKIPFIYQYNICSRFKGTNDTVDVDELQKKLNPFNLPHVLANTCEQEGILETYQMIRNRILGQN